MKNFRYYIRAIISTIQLYLYDKIEGEQGYKIDKPISTTAVSFTSPDIAPSFAGPYFPKNNIFKRVVVLIVIILLIIGGLSGYLYLKKSTEAKIKEAVNQGRQMEGLSFLLTAQEMFDSNKCLKIPKVKQDILNNQWKLTEAIVVFCPLQANLEATSILPIE